MNTDRQILNSLSGFLFLFVLGGIIHIAAWGIDGLNNVTELYYCVLICIWCTSVHRRITDNKIKFILMGSAALMLLAYLLQTCRFLLMSGLNDVRRYLLYGNYIIILLQAVLSLEIGLYMTDLKREKHISKLVSIITVVILLLILTNDLHQGIIYYPEGLEYSTDIYSYRIGLYIYYGWTVICYLGYCLLAYKSCRVSAVRKKIWLPIFFPVVGGVLLALHVFDMPQINGHVLWHIEDIMFLVCIGLANTCIELGLIPSNTDYNRLFKLAKNRAVITDPAGNVVYSSSDEDIVPVPSGDIIVDSKEIHGGKIIWTVDVSAINKLNRQLSEATEEINLRNEYLQHQNELKKEKSLLDARNSLYDRISHIVSDKLDAVSELMEGLENTAESRSEDTRAEDTKTRRTLAHIAVLNAYIKRRSNMELLRGESDILSLKELFTALAESCEYLKLCGVTAAAVPAEDRMLNAVTVITAYDFFENVIESSIDRLSSLMVRASVTGNELTLRILTDAAVKDSPAGAMASRFSELNARYSAKTEDGVTTFVLTIPEGGDGK